MHLHRSTHFNEHVPAGFITFKMAPLCGTSMTKGKRAISGSQEVMAARIRTTSDVSRVDYAKCFEKLA